MKDPFVRSVGQRAGATRRIALACVAFALVAASTVVVAPVPAAATSWFVPSAGGWVSSPITGLPFSSGIDYSANAASVPLSGYVLLLTIPANSTRNSLEVQNQSTDTLQLVRDDGAGNNQTSLMLAPAGGTGGQGGGWSSTTFFGRIRVYAPSSSDRVAAYQE